MDDPRSQTLREFCGESSFVCTCPWSGDGSARPRGCVGRKCPATGTLKSIVQFPPAFRIQLGNRGLLRPLLPEACVGELRGVGDRNHASHRESDDAPRLRRRSAAGAGHN
ncbi:hypothetical protein TcBrA4_0076800 [Trypanosoma cruzi]|nr:hypothetical protein TcBrA4_0076800 [Trypanosoma cruzi]